MKTDTLRQHPPQPTHLRVFLASPGDVAEERQLALEVLSQLPDEPVFRGKITVQTVAWDKPGAGVAMEAHLTPQAALTFASSFYHAMLGGARFGEAVHQARAKTFEHHRASNTWGAFQAYGDECYRFPEIEEQPRQEQSWQIPGYLHASQLSAELDFLLARLPGAIPEERNEYQHRLTHIEKAGARWLLRAEIQEKLGAAWAGLGERRQAIHHYRAALFQEDGGVSLHGIEQLANLEIRYGAKEVKDKNSKEGRKFMRQGCQRLEALIKMAPTVERLCLLASYWKRRLQVARSNEKERVLQEMAKRYWEATEESLRRTGERDYYPLLNTLDAAFLLKVQGQGELFEHYQPQLAELLQEALSNGRRRFQEERKFFHALIEAEAMRIDSLWACQDGREAQALLQQAVQEGLVASYCNVFKRLGSLNEQDSATDQFQFLIDFLPQNGKWGMLREALKGVKDKIKWQLTGASEGRPQANGGFLS
jgi:hypothetical protein